jgi:hypothetical protein
MTTLFEPRRAMWLLLRAWWRRRRCPHIDWTPLDYCPACGKEFR